MHFYFIFDVKLCSNIWQISAQCEVCKLRVLQSHLAKWQFAQALSMKSRQNIYFVLNPVLTTINLENIYLLFYNPSGMEINPIITTIIFFFHKIPLELKYIRALQKIIR